MRRIKSSPVTIMNGWSIARRPGTFAEQFAYEAIALTPDGYQATKHGFQTKREAVAFASANAAPGRYSTFQDHAA